MTAPVRILTLEPVPMPNARGRRALARIIAEAHQRRQAEALGRAA